MIAIQTKFISPTNTKGARIKAWTHTGHAVTIPFNYSNKLDDTNYRKAAELLCQKLNWTGTLVSGSTKDGYIFVFIN